MVSVATALPVASTTATFTPVRNPGSRPMVARAPAGAASSRSRRLAANTPTASSSAFCHSRMRRSTLSRVLIRVREAEVAGDADLVVTGAARWIRLGLAGVQLQVEHLFLLAAEHGQDPVRG